MLKGNMGWIKYRFLAKNIIKGIVPNSPGLYMFFDSSNNPLYIGHSSMLRHRIQSYYQDDCFKTHKTKKTLRPKISMFAFKILPLNRAMALEREIKHKLRFNFR